MSNTTEKANKLYEEGKYEKAFKLYEKAAKVIGGDDDSYAQYSLGYMYYHGQGTARNHKEAAKWFSYANAGGVKYPDGVYLIGDIWRDNKNFESAFVNFKRAAEAGHKESQYETGIMYATGSGTKKDLVQAAEWMEKAAVQGLEAAKSWLADNMGTVKQAKQAAEQADREARTAVCPWCDVTLIYNKPLKKSDILKHNECGRYFRYFDRYTSAPYGMEKCAPQPGVNPDKACPQCGREELEPFAGALICYSCAYGYRGVDESRFIAIEYGNYARLLKISCPHCGEERDCEKPSDLGWGPATRTCKKCGKEFTYE